jgi:predicted ferric reductase
MFWASLLGFGYLWLRSGVLEDVVTKPEGPLTASGKLAGMIAMDLMFVQVIQMARIPVVERAFGRDTLVRLHRVFGFMSLNLMVAHIALLILGYAVRDYVTPLRALVATVTLRHGTVMSAAGAALFVLVGVTSVRAARRRLRYHTWHLLHLYTLLGITLVVPHMIWIGTPFKPLWAKAYVICLYVVSVGSLLVFRLTLPLLRTLRHPLVVDRVVEEGAGSVSVHLRGRGVDRLPFRAGQFGIWRFRDGRGWTRGNPYSLSAVPSGDTLRITAKEVGPNSRRLRTLRSGTRVLVEGPYGRFTAEARHGRKVTMIAAGIGITPVRALLEDLDYEPGDAVLLYRASTEDGFVFRQELEELAQRRGVRVVYLPGRRKNDRSSWQPHGANETDHTALVRLVPDISEHDVYICGPDTWGRCAASAARSAGVPPRRIHVEQFAF